MVFTVQDDLRLLRDLKLTARQLIFVKMLIQDHSKDPSEWRRESYKMALEYQKLCPLSADELADLMVRDIIFDLNDSSGKIYYDCYEINPKYQKYFSLAVLGFPGELAEAYPHEIKTKDFTFMSKDASATEIAPAYLKGIGKKEKEHKAVMDDLRWAIEHNALKVGLKKFVNTKYWLYIRELRKRVNPKPISDARIG